MLLILSHQVFTNNPARLMQAEGGEVPNSHSHAVILYSKHKTCFKIGLITFLGNSIQWGGLWKQCVANCILEPSFSKMEVFDKKHHLQQRSEKRVEAAGVLREELSYLQTPHLRPGWGCSSVNWWNIWLEFSLALHRLGHVGTCLQSQSSGGGSRRTGNLRSHCSV